MSERASLHAAYALGGFTDADETERTTIWAAERIEKLEVALHTVMQRVTYGYQDLNAGDVLATLKQVAQEALDDDS